MQQIKKIFNKYDTIFIAIFFMIILIGRILYIRFDSGDELWNFSNIYKMVNGFVIYQDMNVIITPLFFYLGEVFLKLTSGNYLAFKWYGIIIDTIFFTLIYVILTKLKVKKGLSMLYVIGIFIQYKSSILVGANYNTLALVFCLIGIIEKLKETKYSTVVQGIIIFLITMTKQNIGLFYFVGLVLYEIIKTNTWKNRLKYIMQYGIVVGVLGIGFLLFLQMQGNLIPFINYTVLGIKEFAVYNFEIELLVNVILIVSVAILLIYCIREIKHKKNDEISNTVKNNIILLSSIGITLLAISYPIFNMGHIISALTVAQIGILYIMNDVIQELYNKYKKIVLICTILLAIAIMGKSIYYLYEYQKDIKQQEYKFYHSQVYKGLLISKEMQNEINEVINFIQKENLQGIEVKILSHRSNIYMNLLNKDNGKMDLPFLGNLGKSGEDGLILEIQKLKNSKILLSKSEEVLYQESKKVREYIKTNLKKIGEVAEFDVYETD